MRLKNPQRMGPFRTISTELRVARSRLVRDLTSRYVRMMVARRKAAFRA
jgi:hypothetical protein